jgi:hypothetical protein
MPGDGARGLPADQFLHAFGDLYFNVGYEINQMFARLISVDEMDRQLSRIEREIGDASPPSPSRMP